MKNQPVFLIIFFCLIGLAGLTACGDTRATRTNTSTAILFDSPVAEDAFSLGCLKGAEQAKLEFGIRLSFFEAGSDAEAAELLEELVKESANDLIICIGSSQTAAIEKIARQYPRQKLASVDGSLADLSNVSSLITRDNESSYLAGALAALVSKSSIIGFVGGRDMPSIHRFLAGYRAGARAIKPDCVILTDYTGNWLNDGKSRALALEQINRGADVLFGPAGAGSLGVIEAAKEKAVWAVGVDADQSPLAPDTVLVSVVKHMNVSVHETIRSLVENRFKGGIQSSGLKEGAVEAKINPAISVITPEMHTILAGLQQKIIDGTIQTPAE